MDIRLTEFEQLAEIERVGHHHERLPLQGRKKDLLAFLAFKGYVNDLNIPWVHNERLSNSLPGESEFERRLHQNRVDTLSRILGGRDVTLEITHAGRIRMAELAQALRSSKLREQHGILWDGRHFETDLRLAIVEASDAIPVAVVYLDMNGLKNLNDGRGHANGDIAVQAYFQSFATALSDQGDGYRLGGDEVGLVIRACTEENATKIIRRSCALFHQRSLELKKNNDEFPSLSFAAGLIITKSPVANPEQLRCDAEKSMYKAKNRTKENTSRPSSWHIVGQEEVFVFEQ